MKPTTAAAVGAVAATSGTMLALDLGWLGVVARRFYDSSLGALKRRPVNAPVAGLFYAFYAAALCGYAVFGSKSPAEAARRGAGLGLVAYGTYQLTNWAVLEKWPVRLVPVDVAWGVAVTSLSAWAGKQALTSLERR